MENITRNHNALMQAIDSINNATDEEWDNLAEFSIEDIVMYYFVENHDAKTIYNYIQSHTDIRYSIDKVLRERPIEVIETLQESIHQSFDGYNELEQFIIRSYLADLALAVNVSKKD